MKTRALLSYCYEALDAMTFASSEELPSLTRRYHAAFAAHVAVLQRPASGPSLDRCEHCCKWYPAASLAPLDTDWTANQAARDWSLERMDLLCKDCRNELEHEYGVCRDDGADSAFENAMDR